MSIHLHEAPVVRAGTLYGVQADTLAAYVAAERKKIWEEAAGYLETESHRLRNVGAASYRGMLAVAEIFRNRAAKETR